MTERDGADDHMTGALSLPLRTPAKRLGVVVVEALVDLIVSGELEPGDVLPPELPLGQQFGVSRTVLRESIKKLEEKGLVTVRQGRGTVVQPTRSWNMLDRVVLEALIAHDRSLIAHDRSLGVLDELTVVRAQLESAMARETAATHSHAELEALRGTLEEMRTSLDDIPRFLAADVAFHETVMALSHNRLAESIARSLFERARESGRYSVDVPAAFHEQTLREHEQVFAAIAAGSADEAASTMLVHIVDAWTRRRPADHQGAKGGR